MITLLLDQGPGENGKTEKRTPLSSGENDILLLYHYDYLRLLNIDAEKWSLDQRPLGPLIHRRWLPAFHLEMGALRPPVVIFAERAGSQWRPGLSPGLSPFWAFSAEVPLLVHNGGRHAPPNSSPESCDEVMVSYPFLSF
jgi:hypothetical protein